MTKVNSMVFALDYYGDDSDAMWADIANFLKMLMKNNFTAIIRDDDVNIIVIEYEHDENKESWGCTRPVWVDSDAYEDVMHLMYDEDKNS